MEKCEFIVYGIIDYWPTPQYGVPKINPAILEAAKKPVFESPKVGPEWSGIPEIEDTWEDVEF